MTAKSTTKNIARKVGTAAAIPVVGVVYVPLLAWQTRKSATN